MRLGVVADTLDISCEYIMKHSLYHSARLNADCIKSFHLDCHNDLKKPDVRLSLVEIKYSLSVTFKWIIKPFYP